MIFNDNLAKVAEQYLKKGMKVYIEGQLQTRKWQDQTGNDRYTTEIVLQKFRGELQMLDARGQGGEGGRSAMAAAGAARDFGQSGSERRCGGGGRRRRRRAAAVLARPRRRDPVLSSSSKSEARFCVGNCAKRTRSSISAMRRKAEMP